MTFIERKKAGAKKSREAVRCVKRHISRTVFKTMLRADGVRGAEVLDAEFTADAVTAAV
jgi:hypothetical protein